MSAPELIFEEPPPLHSGRGHAGESPLGLFLQGLRQHPGRWAKFPDIMGRSVSTSIRKGTGYGVAAGEYDVRTVTEPGCPNRVTIYARYIGGES